jgi:hypothetical protein
MQKLLSPIFSSPLSPSFFLISSAPPPLLLLPLFLLLPDSSILLFYPLYLPFLIFVFFSIPEQIEGEKR